MDAKTRRVGNILALCLALVGGMLAKGHWPEIVAYAKGLVPIRHVRIEGRFRYLTQDEVKQALMPVVNLDFFSANVRDIDRVTESIPWVVGSEVKRIWPDTIDIRIEEQVPVARWGETSLLNINGVPFNPRLTDELRRLPMIVGPQGYEKILLQLMYELRADLARSALGLRAFQVSERRSWKLMLDNGMEVELGRQKPRSNFQRLLRVLPVLGAERIAMVQKIDMRYPNGFAVTWKPGAVVTWPTKGEPQAGVAKE